MSQKRYKLKNLELFASEVLLSKLQCQSVKSPSRTKLSFGLRRQLCWDITTNSEVVYKGLLLVKGNLSLAWLLGLLLAHTNKNFKRNEKKIDSYLSLRAKQIMSWNLAQVPSKVFTRRVQWQSVQSPSRTKQWVLVSRDSYTGVVQPTLKYQSVQSPSRTKLSFGHQGQLYWGGTTNFEFVPLLRTFGKGKVSLDYRLLLGSHLQILDNLISWYCIWWVRGYSSEL